MIRRSLPGYTLSFRTRAYGYDNHNRLAASTSYDGQDAVITQYTYDDAGTGLTSPLTITGLDEVTGGSAGYSTTEYAYDTQSRLTGTTDPLDQTESYTYDSKSGRLLTKTDRNDVVTTYTYDNLGRETRREAGTGDYVATTYTLSGQKASESNGTATTAFTYDDLGRLTAEVTGDAIKTYSYNLGGARTAFAAAVDGTSQISLAYTYDAMNRLSTVSGNSTSASYGYTDNGNLEYVQYGNGLREEYTYNKANLLTGLVNELGSTTLSQYGYTYTLDGQQVQKTEPNNKVTAYTYDGHGRLTDETVTLNSVLQQSYAYTYDAFGNRTGLEAAGADAYETAYTYDANNRLLEETKETAGLTEIATYYYDANGNETAKVSSTLQSSADPAEVSLSQGVADSELLSYNGFNELTAVAKGEDEITYAYLPNGLRLSKTADAATTGFVWDGSNTVLELTGDAVTTQYSYDIHGRKLTEEAGDETTSYTYDAVGNQLTVTNASDTVTRVYDEQNRVISKTVSGVGTSTYLYDVTTGVPAYCTGEVTTDAKGNVSTRVYDRAGRLYQIISGSDVTTYTYMDNGSLELLTYPNGLTAEYTYYDNNKLHTLANKSGATILSAYNYAYDAAGNLVSELDINGTTTYTYDELNRLESVTEPDGKLTQYAYDAAGNRVTETVTDGSDVTTTDYVYDEDLNRLTGTGKTLPSGALEATLYFYDMNGALVSKHTETLEDAESGDEPALSLSLTGNGGDGYALYAYDVWGQLTTAETPDSVSAYAYNGEGLRVSKSVTEDAETTETAYLYEYSKVVLELDENGDEAAHNVYGNNTLISRTTGDGTLYYLYNGHGDVVQLADALGAIVMTYDYDAFGVVTTATGSISNSYLYSGYQYDGETGMYYLNAPVL